MFRSENLTILYIEPNAQTQKKTARFLEENGLHVFITDNAVSGLDLFHRYKIDIIFIDIQDPIENGYQLIRHLRQKNIMTPVIITTNNTTKEVLLEAINLDITHFLVLPYQEAELIEALHLAIKKVLFCHPLAYTELHEGFSYDPINKVINRPDQSTIKLTKKEYMLIELLLHSKNQVISYNTIEDTIWHDGMMSIDALRTLIRGIRKKTYPSIIINHTGIGYKIQL